MTGLDLDHPSDLDALAPAIDMPASSALFDRRRQRYRWRHRATVAGLALAAVAAMAGVIRLAGIPERQSNDPVASTVTTIHPVVIGSADITVVTEPLRLSLGTSLLPAGELPATLPNLAEIKRAANQLLSNNPDALGPDLYYGRLERGHALGDGEVVIAVRFYDVLMMPLGGLAGGEHAGPGPGIDTTFYDASTGEYILQEQTGCDPSGCTVPAIWKPDPDRPPSPTDRVFTALVTRFDCASGVTGTVMEPEITTSPESVVVTFNVVPQPEDDQVLTCQGNNWVPYDVDIGEALGNRQLIDGNCLPGGQAADTSFCIEPK